MYLIVSSNTTNATSSSHKLLFLIIFPLFCQNEPSLFDFYPTLHSLLSFTPFLDFIFYLSFMFSNIYLSFAKKKVRVWSFGHLFLIFCLPSLDCFSISDSLPSFFSCLTSISSLLSSSPSPSLPLVFYCFPTDRQLRQRLRTLHGASPARRPRPAPSPDTVHQEGASVPLQRLQKCMRQNNLPTQMLVYDQKRRFIKCWI